MHQGLSISVVIPAHNEEGGIGHVLESIPDYVDELIVVDNNSTDRTAEIARSKGAITVFELRRGYGSALRCGFQVAKKDVIVAMDADGTYPAERIADLMDVLQRENADFISCSRFPLTNKNAMSGRNIFGNKVMTVLFGLIYGKWLKDSQSGMWVFRRRVLPLMHFEGTTWEFSSEIKIEACTNAHIKFLEMHINYHPRVGYSHFHTWRGAIAVGIRDIGFLVSQRFVRRRTRQHRAYEQALRRQFDNAEAHNNLGIALAQRGTTEEAITQFEQALRFNPDYAEAHYNLGNTLRQAGQVPEAIAHYEQALRIKPDFTEAHYNLGNTLAQVGRVPEAIVQYEQALRIKPDFTQAQNALARLQARR